MGTQIKKISKFNPSFFQGKLDFSATRKDFSLTMAHPYETFFLRTLMLILLVLCFGYLYFVGASVLNIIARKEASAETIRLQSAIATMEQEYFALTHSVDASVASTIGLTTVAKTQYVYRPGNAAAATISSNGL